MHQTLGVKISKRVEKGLEHVVGFGMREGALREELREIFFGAFHDHVKKSHAGELATAGFKKLEQVGMRELSGLLPTRELSVSLRGGDLNELDSGLLRLAVSLAFGEKDHTVVRAA